MTQRHRTTSLSNWTPVSAYLHNRPDCGTHGRRYPYLRIVCSVSREILQPTSVTVPGVERGATRPQSKPESSGIEAGSGRWCRLIERSAALWLRRPTVTAASGSPSPYPPPGPERHGRFRRERVEYYRLHISQRAAGHSAHQTPYHAGRQ